jgi:hypothetical protein
MSRAATRIAFLSIMMSAACLGSYGGPRDPGAGGDPAAPGGGPPVPTPPAITDGPDGSKVGGRDLRRLSVREIDESLRDVFALGDAWPGTGLGPDRASALGFDNDTTLLAVDAARAEELAAAAERVADAVMAKGFASLPACAGGPSTRACAAAVVEAYAPRLHRRALTQADRDRYLAAWDGMVAAQASGADALRFTIVALVSSPHFLYRFELGAPTGAAGTYALTGEELATALAYDFGGGPPSAELLERARAGALGDPAARVAEARALLETPRGRALVDAFMQRWLHYDEVRTLAKSDAVAPGFAALRGDLAEETRRFLQRIFYDTNGGVAALLTSAETVVSPALAQHYGLAPPATLPFGVVTRPPSQAIGLLAQGSILARHALTDGTSPPQRGAFVRRRLLCQDLPPPPPNVGEPPTPQPGVTTRERYQQVTSPPACAGCHRLINDVGFALESFDAAGRFRSTENGKPIDASGVIASFGTQPDARFADAVEAARLLAASPDVARCVGGTMAAFTFGMAEGRALAAPADTQALVAGQASLRDFFARLAAAPHFALRIER